MHAVTAAYLFAGGLTALVLFSIGWAALLLVPLFLIWHGLRCTWVREPVVRSHDAFLLRSHLLLGMLLLALYAIPFCWALLIMDPDSEVAAILGTRDPEAVLHWFRLWAADQFLSPSPALAASVFASLGWFALHAAASALIAILMMVRLLRRFLRWSDRQAA